jgi:hypothetical protein
LPFSDRELPAIELLNWCFAFTWLWWSSSSVQINLLTKVLGWSVYSHGGKPRDNNENWSENKENPISSIVIVISLLNPIVLELLHAPFNNKRMEQIQAI